MATWIRITVLALLAPAALGLINVARPPARRRSTNTEITAVRAADQALPQSPQHALARRSMMSSSAMALLTSFGAVVSARSEPALAAESLASTKGCYADCTSECNKLAKVS
jgi:hypothetical protein